MLSLVGMFVDVEENVSVLDRIKLTFVFDEVNDNADDQYDAVSKMVSLPYQPNFIIQTCAQLYNRVTSSTTG